jgi:deoxycytidine triphosphate deaminase
MNGVGGNTAGVLGADEIKQEMLHGRLIRGGDTKQLRGCSYDLRIGTIFWDDQMYTAGREPVVVPPGGIVAIMTKEVVSLPDDVCATAFAINQLSSKGFLVLNPGHVDPGFEGALTIKALNVRKVAMPLVSEAAIFTIIFERLPKPTSPYKHNVVDHAERLRAFYSTTVETSARTLFDVMKSEKDGPFPSRDEVDKMIRNHWMTWLTLGFAAVAAIVAVKDAIWSNSTSAAPPSTPAGIAAAQVPAAAQAPPVVQGAAAPATANAPEPASITIPSSPNASDGKDKENGK